MLVTLATFNFNDPRDIPAYSVAEAAHYLGVPPSTLRSWFAGQPYTHRGERKTFRAVIRPADLKTLGLSFSNLIEAYVLTAIRRKHKIGLPTIRRGLDYLTAKLGAKRPLLEERFATHGAKLFVERVKEIINLSQTGQVEMTELIRAHLERVERDAKGVPIKLYPFIRAQSLHNQPRTVVIDPRVSFGRPVIAGTGIPTAVLAERFKAGDQPLDLAKDYGASEEAVWDAIRCELDLKVA
jgi:uncharacterized protein (DUF433 family)